ncbi:hypothetical protein [Streptomyces sp. Amel2xC10]|uniref:hypothetical protein n=1 Tax=Streptomyces sp. Amel2xC10 TaxID=1305826 RepID=UPI000A08467C|nr:hypothetical protein [Streptomyces sp. Amel2xC10]SMF86307.1 hypothetical protein SAMN02745830_07150 [Streptomyces sp. Amel2xC10]
MDPETLAQTAGTTVVALMATDAWQRTRDGVVALWRRVRPAQADEVGTALEETREEILLVLREGDSAGAEDLEWDWRRRLRRLLAADPSAAQELEEVLAEARASLPEAEQPPVPSVQLTAHASGSARIYQAGRDQHITER